MREEDQSGGQRKQPLPAGTEVRRPRSSRERTVKPAKRIIALSEIRHARQPSRRLRTTRVGELARVARRNPTPTAQTSSTVRINLSVSAGASAKNDKRSVAKKRRAMPPPTRYPDM